MIKPPDVATEHERIIARIKALKAERATLIAKLNAGTATNAEAKRIVQIEGLVSAIVGSIQ